MCREIGSTPLEVMLRKMHWFDAMAVREMAKPKRSLEKIAMALDKADEAARGAAPFIHPKLASIEHMGKGGGPIEFTNARERFRSLIDGETAAAEEGGDSQSVN